MTVADPAVILALRGGKQASLRVRSLEGHEHRFMWTARPSSTDNDMVECELGYENDVRREGAFWQQIWTPGTAAAVVPRPKPADSGKRSATCLLPSASARRVLLGWEELIRCLNHRPEQGDTGDDDGRIRDYATYWLKHPTDTKPWFTSQAGTRCAFARRFLIDSRTGLVTYEQRWLL